ncbi:MAG: TetR/AcrR family transcriptional regulator [Synergistaceae bacterium]|nr:TetR/AcrR family transcriptional regulator [Synergistaceae bacterium]
MPKQSGRPLKSEPDSENKQKIIDTVIEMIKKHGADYVTVRKICEAADVSTGTFYYYFKDKDDLMMYFLREALFPEFEKFHLMTPYDDIEGRICELYMRLINKYMELGEKFMKKFYTSGNRSLSAYMSEDNGKFSAGTVMERSEEEINLAIKNGIIKSNINSHVICQDICTIIKGCVFEWCLSGEKFDIETTIHRIIKTYLEKFLR